MNKTGLIGSSIHCVPQSNEFYSPGWFDRIFFSGWNEPETIWTTPQYVEIDPKNIRFTKGFDISKEMYDNRGKKGSTKSRKNS